eukprot:CAMPEP_0116152294 /NCGR_PEP_ID=MMETSP0329-20121206/20571_1 /TAXON_ID=697910 /ORGANISM="Pseudo-nitzschia arenysensis, Strain B593" /LENGTH=238 /DNA_ID=CAMNT_0003648999 /DNA_START=115 /DNA_END=831 /DNA_ORIENTATION=+
MSSETEGKITTAANKNGNAEEWWLPSFPRSPFRSWTEIFFPRNDLIGILANKVVDGMEKQLDPHGPMIQKLLDDHLPKDKESVREKLPFYDSTIDTLKQHRDTYLLGANYKKQQQEQQQQNTKRFVFPLALGSSQNNAPKLPLDSTALGYTQIVHIGSWFVPSKTIKESLLPIVVSLPSGALRGTITSTVTNAIPLAQPPLDNAMKNAVMGVIRDPQIRDMIKSRTQKILRTEDDTKD